MAERLRADLERHAVAVARVVADAPHFGEFPAGAEVARPHLRVGLEAAAREHDGLARQRSPTLRRLRRHAANAPRIVLLQAHRRVRVANVDSALNGDLEELVGEALAPADGLQAEAAPESELAVHVERLVRPRRHEPDALRVHPAHRRERLPDERVRHLLIGEPLRHAHQVVEVLPLRVGADLHHVEFRLREVGDELDDVLYAVVGEADGAAGEVGVAAAHRLGRFFEDGDGLAGFAGGERGAERGVARADDDDICGMGLRSHARNGSAKAGRRASGAAGGARVG